MATKKTTTATQKKTSVKVDKKTTALAVTTPSKSKSKTKAGLDLTVMFSNLDVAALNKAVEDIANRKGKLTSDEKKGALAIIDKWEIGIVEQINNERRKIDTFCDYVERLSCDYRYLIDNPEYIDPLKKIIDAAGLSRKLAPLGAARDEMNTLDEELRIIRESECEYTDGMTEMQRFAVKQEAEKNEFLKRQERDKAKRKFNKLLSELSLELNKNADVKLALSKLRTMSSMLLKNQSECATKANTAKLAITIDDADLREKLKALVLVSLK